MFKERVQFPIAMLRVQYDLLGGSRRLLLTACVYLSILLVGSISFAHLIRQTFFPTVAGYILLALTGFQGIGLMLFGNGEVHRAMLRDFQTKMLESHRLTPMTNITVVLGYMFGASIRVLALFVVNLVIGTLLSAFGGLPVVDWVAGNFLLLSGALMLWALTVFSGMRPSKPTNPVAALVAIGFGFNMYLLLFPGAGLFMGAFSSVLAVWLMTGRQSVPVEAGMVLAGVNAVLATFWVLAAAAKYRRPDLPALNGARGMALLFLWLVVSAGGVAVFQFITKIKMSGFYDESYLPWQWVATMISPLFVACIPISGAVQSRLLVDRGTAARSRFDCLPSGLVAAAAAVLICAVTGGVHYWFLPGLPMIPRELSAEEALTRSRIDVWFWTSMSFVFAVFTARGLMTFFHRLRMKSAQSLLASALFLLWIAPPLFDFSFASATRGRESALSLTWLFGCSPAGTIAAVWASLSVNLTRGMVVQGVVAATVTMLSLFIRPGRAVAVQPVS